MSKLTPPIATAAACRAKAEALREEARQSTSIMTIERLLEIANHWDDLADDYDSKPQNSAA